MPAMPEEYRESTEGKTTDIFLTSSMCKSSARLFTYVISLDSQNSVGSVVVSHFPEGGN